MEPTRVHLVDGTYELYRAHFSHRPQHHSRSGQPIKATTGLVASLLALLHDPAEAVTHIAIAFDNPIASFRNEMFEGYKSDLGVPPELRAQFDLAESAALAMGLVVWSMDRWEADDAMATGAARFRGPGRQVRILSPDKDLAQCIQTDAVVQVDRMRKRIINEQTVVQVRGVGPESIPDWLALVGDTADGIPGVPGIGPRRAAMLLSRYRHIERIPPKPGAWDASLRRIASLAEIITGHRDELVLYKKLATLVDDVPLSEEIDDLAWGGIPRENFDELCDLLGLEQLRARASSLPRRG